MTWRVLAAVGGALALAPAAGAVLPPEVHAQARADAAHHLQMRIDDVKGLSWFQDHGACEVSGEVVRVFSGDMAPGDPLTVAVDCAKPKAKLEPGPQLWTAWRALVDAAYLEVYLTEDGAVARWQTRLLSEPSDEPACPVDGAGPC